MKLLLIAHSAELSGGVGDAVRARGHAVELTTSGWDGLSLALGGTYDVLVVQKSLPDMDGLELVATLRDTGVGTPALFVIGIADVDGRIRSLETAGDDYIVRPFAPAELLARLGALAGQPPPADIPTTLRVADVELDLIKRTVARGGNRIELQTREYQLLQELMRKADRIVSRAMLLDAVWNLRANPKTNVVETHISRLRAKLNQYGGPELIQTVRKAGYALRSSADEG